MSLNIQSNLAMPQNNMAFKQNPKLLSESPEKLADAMKEIAKKSGVNKKEISSAIAEGQHHKFANYAEQLIANEPIADFTNTVVKDLKNLDIIG